MFFHFYTQQNDNVLIRGTLEVFLGKKEHCLTLALMYVCVKLNVWKLKGQDSHSFVFLLSSCI